jgi:inner membrane protein involved in colicin E2 resistance
MNPVLLVLAVLLWLIAGAFVIFGLLQEDDNCIGAGSIVGLIALACSIFCAMDWEDRHPVPKPSNLEQSAPNTGPTHIPKSP